MAYAIRAFRDGDAESLAQLTLAAVCEVGARHYSPEQIEAWAARLPGSQRFCARAAAGDAIFVAADSADGAVAYAVLEPDGHLDMLYCHPAHTRRGLVEELLAASEQHARIKGIARLYTEASELARPAFLRTGYAEIARRDFTLAGVAIHNYAMEKRLT